MCQQDTGNIRQSWSAKAFWQHLSQPRPAGTLESIDVGRVQLLLGNICSVEYCLGIFGLVLVRVLVVVKWLLERMLVSIASDLSNRLYMQEAEA